MIMIIGKRWFQKTWGNTYHSVRVSIDGNEIGYEPYSYGYGDQYLQTAHEILQKAGLFPKTGKRFASGMDIDYHEFLMASRDKSKFTIVVVDVDRKKDL